MYRNCVLYSLILCACLKLQICNRSNGILVIEIRHNIHKSVCTKIQTITKTNTFHKVKSINLIKSQYKLLYNWVCKCVMYTHCMYVCVYRLVLVWVYIWLSLRHWKVPDLTPILEEPWLLLEESMLLVRLISWAAESNRLRMSLIAGLLDTPLLLLLLLWRR